MCMWVSTILRCPVLFTTWVHSNRTIGLETYLHPTSEEEFIRSPVHQSGECAWSHCYAGPSVCLFVLLTWRRGLLGQAVGPIVPNQGSNCVAVGFICRRITYTGWLSDRFAFRRITRTRTFRLQKGSTCWFDKQSTMATPLGDSLITPIGLAVVCSPCRLLEPR